ncbi:MAG: peptide chain release factor N(5)-glutamine methyltransferase [Acidimicrobiia bacterium]
MLVRALADEYELPPYEVERLLMVVTGAARADLVTGLALGDDQKQQFAGLTARRKAGEPLQYLEGTVPFGPIEVAIDSRVLVPRPETEYLFELLLEKVENPRVVVDLCTGSGNLALALKHSFPSARVLATDRSRGALAVAKMNASRLGLGVELLEGDLFAPLPPELRGRVDLIVANPPYVAEADFAELPIEVRSYEPRDALVAGPRGDEVIARIASEVAEWLGSGGWLFCEIGETQSERALELFGASLRAEVMHDLAGKRRYIVARS